MIFACEIMMRLHWAELRHRTSYLSCGGAGDSGMAESNKLNQKSGEWRAPDAIWIYASRAKPRLFISIYHKCLRQPEYIDLVRKIICLIENFWLLFRFAIQDVCKNLNFRTLPAVRKRLPLSFTFLRKSVNSLLPTAQKAKTWKYSFEKLTNFFAISLQKLTKEFTPV